MEGFKHKPVFADENNYKDYMDLGITYPDALDECRQTNIDFSKKVFERIK